ncbi:phosphatidylserine decarboxylase family protein [Blattabacterium punctulatus]|uniref:phosphatidylserine decarboxylase family protein n=1 Tax=Blattabacterium punctulatus TaxID=164514 RepID=UPI000D7D0D7A|nr:phosphatidylserine decarboxylase family protein [Blattabacterium punctulatus]AWU44235.1 phosphatidylserine decarboxylase family protein [Blattabacterium punctulatus]AWU45319.1 phosphatidylserine decarboxylase family protein [Blattabacterium punctulatus]
MIHKEGFPFLIYLLILILIGIFISIFIFSRVFNLFLIFFLIIFYAFFLFFFRNPKKNLSKKKFKNDNEVISPSDGKILEIKKIFESEFLQKNCICISIFMSPFDVHVNRFPVSGKIIYVRYHPGKYWLAWNKKSSLNNERTTTVIETINTKKKILFRQIAGFLARRIILYAKENCLAKKGDEFGFIKFGSRIDIYLPLDSIIFIKKGEKVIGGETIISIIP